MKRLLNNIGMKLASVLIAFLIWLFLLAVSILISFILDVLRKLFHYRQITGAALNRIMEWAGRAL